MSFCDKCNGWVGSDGHRCPPKWVVHLEDDRDSEAVVYAMNSHHAAEKYAEHYDYDTGYAIASKGQIINVVVRDFLTAKEVDRFVIGGEMQPHYRIKEVKR